MRQPVEPHLNRTEHDPTDGAAIDVLGLSRRFGRVWALRDARFQAEWGEVVGLLGPNGSGKTTLLRVLAGVLSPSKGTARVDGLDVVRDREFIRERVGLVSGDAYLYGDLTAAENLDLALALHGRRRRQEPVARALEVMGLSRAARRQVRDFSTGMKKRLALARALLTEPPVLLLDEPYSGLDAEGAEIVHGVVDRWRILGRVVLMATHNDLHARERCDRCVRLASDVPAPGSTPARPALVEVAS